MNIRYRVELDAMERAQLIPTALDTNRCPAACSDGADAVGIGDEPVPDGFTGLDNFFVAVPHLMNPLIFIRL